MRAGYIVVHDALPPQMFQELRQVLWDLRALKISEGRLETETIRQATFSGANRLQEEPVIQRLITNPRVLAKVTDILGANIYVYHAHTNVTPPAEPGTEMPAEYDNMRSWGFHQGPSPFSPPFSPLCSGLELTPLGRWPLAALADSARVNVEMGHQQPDGQGPPNPRPRLALKCAYYLTDMSEPGRGNTWVIPVSATRRGLRETRGGEGRRRGSGQASEGAPVRRSLISGPRVGVGRART